MRTATLLLFSIVLSGCCDLKTYRKFGQSGQTYTKSVGNVLKASQLLSIEANSESLYDLKVRDEGAATSQPHQGSQPKPPEGINANPTDAEVEDFLDSLGSWLEREPESTEFELTQKERDLKANLRKLLELESREVPPIVRLLFENYIRHSRRDYRFADLYEKHKQHIGSNPTDAEVEEFLSSIGNWLEREPETSELELNKREKDLRANFRELLEMHGSRRGVDDPIVKTLFENYIKHSRIDYRFAELYEKLEQHNKVQSRYFDALVALASSDAPSQAEKQADSLAKELESINGDLEFATEKLFGKLNLGVFASWIIKAKICKELKRHLEEHKDTLKTSFVLQSKIYQILAIKAEADLKRIQQSRTSRNLYFYVHQATLDDPSSWNRDRRALFEDFADVPQRWAELSKAADKLEESAAEALKGKYVDLESLNSEIERLDWGRNK